MENDLQETTSSEPRSSFAGAFKSTLRGVDEPHFLTMGLLCGLVIGLLPKFTLLVPLLVFWVVISRANLLTSLLGFGVGCMSLPGLEQGFASLGLSIASQPSLQSIFRELQGLPLVPWFYLNNTVLLGSLCCSAIAIVPVYFVTRPFFNWYQPFLRQLLSRSGWTRWVLGT